MTLTKLGFRKKLALELFRRYRKNEAQLHPLKYILWECTLRCNLKCLHCGSDCKKDALVPDMPSGDFFRALDEISDQINPHQTMIVLTGGEALLRKDLEEIGNGLYQRGFPWGIVSNGMLLTYEKLKALVNAGLRSVSVSLDGLESSHNWLRGNQRSHQQALEAIKLLPTIPGLRYDVVTCVHQKNIKELEQLKRILIQAGIKYWRVFTIFPIGRAMQQSDLNLPPLEFKALFDFIKQTRKEKEISLSYGCEGFLGNYEREVRDNFFICRAGINIASILADGSISACPNLRSNFIQGNIYNDNFKAVWENKFSSFRDKQWTKTGICANCEFYRYCEGNGMHLRDEKTGALLFCHLKRLQEAENQYH